MGLLYDLANRLPYRLGIDTADSIDKPTPELDVHRQFYLHERHLPKGTPTSYSEALHDRSEIDLVAGCDRDPNRLQAFGDRYGEVALYTDGAEMLEKEKLDIVAIATNTKSRPKLVRLAVENGAKAVVTDKPMCHTLAEADLMVGVCRDAGVPLNCGAISTTHPSFAKAKELLESGAIGDVISMETSGRPGAQHQNWSYFLNSAPAWVVGTADQPPLETGSSEFKGQGLSFAKTERSCTSVRALPCCESAAPPGRWSTATSANGASPKISTPSAGPSASTCRGRDRRQARTAPPIPSPTSWTV